MACDVVPFQEDGSQQCHILQRGKDGTQQAKLSLSFKS